VAGARESGAEATRKRLAEADQRRAEEEREAAAKRARHQRHTAGRLSEEEKARRLREMMCECLHGEGAGRVGAPCDTAPSRALLLASCVSGVGLVSHSFARERTLGVIVHPGSDPHAQRKNR